MRRIIAILSAIFAIINISTISFASFAKYEIRESTEKIIVNKQAFSPKDSNGTDLPLIEINGVLYVPFVSYTNSLGENLTRDSLNQLVVGDSNTNTTDSPLASTSTQEGFSFSKPSIEYNSEFGISTLLAQITNNTKTTYSVVGFTCNFYDDAGNLKDTISYLVNGLSSGQTKSFSVPSYKQIQGTKYAWQIDYTF